MSHLLDNYYIIALIKILIVVAVLMHVLAYLQWVERKVIAHVQVRPGPYNVGWHGLLQPLADVLKLITKEDMMPPYANTFLYLLAPFLAVFMALALHRRDSLRPHHRCRRPPHLDAAYRSERRRALYPGRLFHGRLRRCARRVGVEQQVRSARRIAKLGADDQL